MSIRLAERDRHKYDRSIATATRLPLTGSYLSFRTVLSRFLRRETRRWRSLCVSSFYAEVSSAECAATLTCQLSTELLSS